MLCSILFMTFTPSMCLLFIFSIILRQTGELPVSLLWV